MRQGERDPQEAPEKPAVAGATVCLEVGLAGSRRFLSGRQDLVWLQQSRSGGKAADIVSTRREPRTSSSAGPSRLSLGASLARSAFHPRGAIRLPRRASLAREFIDADRHAQRGSSRQWAVPRWRRLGAPL